jgi:hypothetical protein
VRALHAAFHISGRTSCQAPHTLHAKPFCVQGCYVKMYILPVKKQPFCQNVTRSGSREPATVFFFNTREIKNMFLQKVRPLVFSVRMAHELLYILAVTGSKL